MDPFPEINDDRPRSCWLEIDLDALLNNLRVVRDALPTESRILAVVKAEAYGHGAEMIARTLSRAGVNHFGVATLEEALKLRVFGIDDSVYIMGHTATFKADEMIRRDLIPFVYSFRLLNALNEEAAKQNTVAPLHLKVDTGMGRLGLLPRDVPRFLDEVNACENVRLDGVVTHLAVAGEDPAYTRRQFDALETVRRAVNEAGLEPRFWHSNNTAAIFSDTPETGNLVRPGIALYGYPPHDEVEIEGLQPIMQVKTKMADYKRLDPGTGISYGLRFQPETPTWVGVLPVGYADGYPRSFSNRAHVLKHGRKCRVLGSVCMDMTIVELTENDDPEETVTLLGRDGERELWADRLADWDDTIPYEILSGFSQRLPRIYLREGKARAMKTEREIRQL